MRYSLVFLALFAGYSIADDSDICSNPEYAERAQCNIENPANTFNWVDESDYQDNIVQVQYGVSRCGGLLVNGKYIITARHCTPLWDSWNYGGTLKVFQGINLGENLVFEGNETEVFAIDNDQRHINAEQYLHENWQPSLQRIEDEANETFNGKTTLSINNWLERWDEPNDLNDLVIIKLPSPIAHSSNSAFVLTNNIDKALDVPWQEYKQAFNRYSDNYKFMYQGWGKNAYGFDPYRMKSHDLTLNRTQLELLEARIKEDFGFQRLYMYFNTQLSFFRTCDSEALINNGDSGTPVFDQDGYAVGFSSRISGSSCGQAADFSGHLAFLELYKHTINGITYPTNINLKRYDDELLKPISQTFDIQNLSNDAQTVTPTLTSHGDFALEHNCPQTLDFFESCRVTISYTGTQNIGTYTASFSANDTSLTPVSVTIESASTRPTEPEVETELPKEIIIKIGKDSPSISSENTLDVSFLSNKEKLLEEGLQLKAIPRNDQDFVPAQWWIWWEHQGEIDISQDATKGELRQAIVEWGFQFDSKNHTAEPGIYEAVFVSERGEVPIKVIYREDEINDPDEGTNPDEDKDTDTDTPSKGGDSGGSLGFWTLLALLMTRRKY